MNDTFAFAASTAPLPDGRCTAPPHGDAVRVRTARAADAAAACDLLRAAIARTCAPDHGHDPAILARWLANKTPAQVAAWIASPANHCVVAELAQAKAHAGIPQPAHAGALAGIALLTRKGRIALLHVAPDRLRCGVGGVLLAALERQARAWGVTALRVDGTRSAAGFFVRHGYRAGASVETPYGIDAVALGKRLVPSYAQRAACGCGAGESSCPSGV